MSAWGWQDSGPASDFVSSARPGGNPAEILRRQNMRLNPSVGNPFQITPQQRAGILDQQLRAGTGGGNSSNVGFKNGGMSQNPMQNALNNVQMQPNNGRPVGAEFAHGVQMNPIMGGVRNEPRMQAPQMQPFQQLPPSDNTGVWNAAFSQANGLPVNQKWDQAGQQAYLRQIASANPNQSRNQMPGTQQMGMQQGNQQQQLMMLLQQLLGRG